MTVEQPLTLPNHDQLQYPYSNNWIFFVNDNPYGLWTHPCRYIFVDAETGQYSIVDEVVYPIGLADNFEVISQIQLHAPVPSTSQPRILPEIAPNSHLYAVLIIGGIDQDFWNDLSALYTTLIQNYGYKKENIFVHYFTGIQTGSYYPLNDLDGDLNFNDIDYPAYLTSVHQTFQYLAGDIHDPLDKVPELQPDDQLFIYIGDHGLKDASNTHSYLCLPQESDPNQWDLLEDDEFAGYIQYIKCGQMIIMMGQCYSGSFIGPVMDYNTYPPSCKNRTIQTVCGSNPTQIGNFEYYITAGAFTEFIFYWTAALRGYFPYIDVIGNPTNIQPWFTGDPVYPMTDVFLNAFPPADYSPPTLCWDHKSPQFSNVDPDSNHDGVVTMDEAFSFADNMDSYSGWPSLQNYYCPHMIQGWPNPDPEDPDSMKNICFHEDLQSLNGLEGNITISRTLDNRSYIVGGPLDIENAILALSSGTNIYFINDSAKLRVHSGSTLSPGTNTLFAGKENNYVYILNGG